MSENLQQVQAGIMDVIQLEQELALLYEAHSGGLFNFAYSLLHDRAESQDAVQEVFLRYFQERRCGGTIENTRAWLFRVLRNSLFDWLDKASRRREVTGNDADEFAVEGSDPEHLVEQAQTASLIRSVLSDRELSCLLLRVEGLSYLEVADVLDLRVGTVGVYLSRVQSKLREAARDDPKFQRGAAQALALLCHEAAH